MPNLETAVVNSALWAATGDALGWMAELTDESGVVRRTGQKRITEPVEWQRKIGGRGGVYAQLPAGTYSDDTQLRLAVCRAIRGDGDFDAEAFARIELTVWLSYSLGAGRGSKAAASNLTKRDVGWYSNFYSSTSGRGYAESGGNGAAMRIQPHVWQRGHHSSDRSWLGDVVRDSITTHGHIQAILGAVFHADCVAYVLRAGEPPSPESWWKFVSEFPSVAEAVRDDSQLARFWLPTWEAKSKNTLKKAILDVMDEVGESLKRLNEVINDDPEKAYPAILNILHLHTEEKRGAGLYSAIAAAALSWLHRRSPVEIALQQASNALGSDTDTIATMVGAVLGAATERQPAWPIQDRDYIIMEAKRLVRLSQAETPETFLYPDLFEWEPPPTQSDAIGIYGSQLAVAGLGYVEPIGEEWISGDFVWRWLRLPFGQTILGKMRKEPITLQKQLLPRRRTAPGDEPRGVQRKQTGTSNRQQPLFAHALPESGGSLLKESESHLRRSPTHSLVQDNRQRSAHYERRSLDDLTNDAIRSNFDPRIIGERLLESMGDGEDAIEKAMGYAAILAKAHLARLKRGIKR